MIRFVVVAVFVFCCVPVYGMPQFLQLYRSDPFRNPSVDGCDTCHMSPTGGDARNAFGEAFQAAGEQITPMLRAQFPDRFVYPTSRVSDVLTVHFSDPGKKQVVIDAGGTKSLIDADRTAVNGAPAGAPPPPARAEAVRQPRNEVPVDPYAREGAFFGSNVVNLPDGKPQKKGGVDFFVGHRFTQSVGDAKLAGLFGFDSSATVAFGVRVGITDRLSLSILRSNLFQTISLGSAFQVSRQSAETPVTVQLRASVDGVRNFGLYDRDNNPAPRQYQPVLQGVITRTFKDRVSLTAVPTFAFNTRDELRDFPGFAFGTDHNNTVALGVGLGVRFLPTTSLVGEYIPRLWGFRGEIKDRPGVSIGLQKSTFRHTFELLISRQQPMTPAQYAFQGTDTFKIGFNIYRRLR
jgi:Membrane bound beta barrel domain (DUF5777)